MGYSLCTLPDATTLPRFFTVEEVAERLRLHRATVYRYLHDDGLPYVRLGGDLGPLRVREFDLEAWLADRGDR